MTEWQAIPELPAFWETRRFIRGGFPLRALAFRLASGDLGIWSPIRGLGADAHRSLQQLGRPALIVAPNHFHNLGLREYAGAYPDARVVATAVAAPRVRAQSGQKVESEDLLRASLPAHAALLIPPGTRNGEMWLSLAGAGARGRTWVVCDAFFNVARTPRSLAGLLLRALNVSAGLRISTTWRWILKDRAGYRKWLLETIAAERPTTLVPSHGELITDDALPDRLERLARARL